MPTGRHFGFFKFMASAIITCTFSCGSEGICARPYRSVTASSRNANNQNILWSLDYSFEPSPSHRNNMIYFYETSFTVKKYRVSDNSQTGISTYGSIQEQATFTLESSIDASIKTENIVNSYPQMLIDFASGRFQIYQDISAILSDTIYYVWTYTISAIIFSV